MTGYPQPKSLAGGRVAGSKLSSPRARRQAELVREATPEYKCIREFPFPICGAGQGKQIREYDMYRMHHVGLPRVRRSSHTDPIFGHLLAQIEGSGGS